MVSWTAPWRSTDQYQTIGTLYSQKESIRWYWRFISQIAVYMILGGYLILPTTFYGDPNKKLRYNKGVLAIIIVALLTGGYSLTALVWFACPPTLFRIDHIFIPVFSVSLFAFFATCYALASSSEYDFSNPAAPTTLALTLASALIYGVFALMLRRGIKKQRAMHRESLQHAQNPASAAAANWHASNSYPAYDPHAISSPHARSPSTAYDPYAARSIASLDGNSMMTMTPHTAQAPSEEELVKKQMAKLLTRPDLGLHNNSSRSTFHLDWTPGEEPDVELEGSSAVRQHGRSDSNQLTVPTTGRKRSQSAGNMLSSSSMQHKRGTREDRRREIEMANLSSRR